MQQIEADESAQHVDDHETFVKSLAGILNVSPEASSTRTQELEDLISKTRAGILGRLRAP